MIGFSSARASAKKPTSATHFEALMVTLDN